MADTTLYTNALAVYDFENNANDTKGARNLTAVGTPTYSTTGEAQGTYWAVCNGTTQYFSRADSTFAFTGSYSISLYFQLDSADHYAHCIASYYDGGNGGGWGVMLNNSHQLVVTHRVAWSNTTYTFTTTLSDSTRYHLALSYNTTSNELWAYVSTTSFGNIINTHVDATTDPGSGSSGSLFIGRQDFDDGYLDGNIDEVVFWNSAITSTDAENIFNACDGGTSWRETAAGFVFKPFRRLNVLLRMCLNMFSTLFGRLFK